MAHPGRVADTLPPYVIVELDVESPSGIVAGLSSLEIGSDNTMLSPVKLQDDNLRAIWSDDPREHLMTTTIKHPESSNLRLHSFQEFQRRYGLSPSNQLATPSEPECTASLATTGPSFSIPDIAGSELTTRTHETGLDSTSQAAWSIYQTYINELDHLPSDYPEGLELACPTLEDETTQLEHGDPVFAWRMMFSYKYDQLLYDGRPLWAEADTNSAHDADVGADRHPHSDYSFTEENEYRELTQILLDYYVKTYSPHTPPDRNAAGGHEPPTARFIYQHQKRQMHRLRRQRIRKPTSNSGGSKTSGHSQGARFSALPEPDRKSYRFACPFAKLVPGWDARCLDWSAGSISHMKEHLRNIHFLHCGTCMVDFMDPQKQNEHRCPGSHTHPVAPHHFMTEDQFNAINVREKVKMPKLDQWQRIYQILCPNAEPDLQQPRFVGSVVQLQLNNSAWWNSFLRGARQVWDEAVSERGYQSVLAHGDRDQCFDRVMDMFLEHLSGYGNNSIAPPRTNARGLASNHSQATEPVRPNAGFASGAVETTPIIPLFVAEPAAPAVPTCQTDDPALPLLTQASLRDIDDFSNGMTGEVGDSNYGLDQLQVGRHLEFPWRNDMFPNVPPGVAYHTGSLLGETYDVHGHAYSSPGPLGAGQAFDGFVDLPGPSTVSADVPIGELSGPAPLDLGAMEWGFRTSGMGMTGSAWSPEQPPMPYQQ